MAFDTFVAIQVAGTAGTLAAAIAALLTAREMQRQSRNSVRPYAVLTGTRFERTVDDDDDLKEATLSIENVGQGPMLDVSITWDFARLYENLSDRFVLNKESGYLKFEAGKKHILFNLGSALDFRNSSIKRNEKNDFSVPQVVMAIVDETLVNYFSSYAAFDEIEPYFHAKLEYSDMYENKFNTYDIYMYKKSTPYPSYAAQWKALKSTALEL
ncbi:hypothetical protein [Mesorhizobium ventifaucium]|uniref:Phage tail protein n=1 Tax=Mesorhizobium ventifaucium TaxID=666020 RepID=A0ABN8JEZ8_9HYPH|nr:hypothetical protein [Mesorhizobium ventifaucium]CAH2396259.1 hypothetical protein MES4922_160107 [Mesorhizobium ventifaucium]